MATGENRAALPPGPIVGRGETRESCIGLLFVGLPLDNLGGETNAERRIRGRWLKSALYMICMLTKIPPYRS